MSKHAVLFAGETQDSEMQGRIAKALWAKAMTPFNYSPPQEGVSTKCLGLPRKGSKKVVASRRFLAKI